MKERKVLIVGAGIAGKKLLKEIIAHKEFGLQTLGFIDDDKKKIGTSILGVPVLGSIKEITHFIKSKKIEKILIALPSVDGTIISEVVKKCLEVNTTCQIIPRFGEIIEGKVNISRVRNVRIDDLLGRPVRITKIKDIKNLINEQIIMITGAAGSIGSELCRQLASYKPKKIIMFDCWENGLYDLGMEFKEFFPYVNYVLTIGNIQDKERVESVIRLFKPAIIFHAAAYKHVPLMEENPTEAVKNNIFGTKNLVEIAKKYQIKKFIFISTDKAANPQSIMGITKLIGEHISISANEKGNTQFICTRFGNVLDSFGSVLPLFKKQISLGGPITITDKKMTRFFMTIPEAVQLILKAATLGTGGEIFILDMGKPVKIVDLAKRFILLSGFLPEKEIKIKYIGSRPGEKIKEELIAPNEELLKTDYQTIFKIKRNSFSKPSLEILLNNLLKKCQKDDAEGLIKELKRGPLNDKIVSS